MPNRTAIVGEWNFCTDDALARWSWRPPCLVVAPACPMCATHQVARDQQAAGDQRAARDQPAARDAAAHAGALERFSESASGGEPPLGWQPWIIHPRKRKTSYRIVRDGIAVLAASASSSASGLMARRARPAPAPGAALALARRRAASPTPTTVMDRARTPRSGGARVRRRQDPLADPRPDVLRARQAPFGQRLALRDADVHLGNRRPVRMLENPHSARIRKMIVDSGPGELKRWRMHRRNIVEDYRRAPSAPNRVA